MPDQRNEFDQIKKDFAVNFNLDPNHQSNSDKLLQFYHAQVLNMSIEAKKLRPIRYRREKLPVSMMLMEDLRDAGTEKSGLFHQVVNGIATINTGEGQKEVSYSYGLVEDVETGNLYTVDLELIRFQVEGAVNQ